MHPNSNTFNTNYELLVYDYNHIQVIHNLTKLYIIK